MDVQSVDTVCFEGAEGKPDVKSQCHDMHCQGTYRSSLMIPMTMYSHQLLVKPRSSTMPLEQRRDDRLGIVQERLLLRLLQTDDTLLPLLLW